MSLFNHLISFFPFLNKKVEDYRLGKVISFVQQSVYMTGSLFARWTEKMTLSMSIRNEVV